MDRSDILGVGVLVSCAGLYLIYLISAKQASSQDDHKSSAEERILYPTAPHMDIHGSAAPRSTGYGTFKPPPNNTHSTPRAPASSTLRPSNTPTREGLSTSRSSSSRPKEISVKGRHPGTRYPSPLKGQTSNVPRSSGRSTRIAVWCHDVITTTPPYTGPSKGLIPDWETVPIPVWLYTAQAYNIWLRDQQRGPFPIHPSTSVYPDVQRIKAGLPLRIVLRRPKKAKPEQPIDEHLTPKDTSYSSPKAGSVIHEPPHSPDTDLISVEEVVDSAFLVFHPKCAEPVEEDDIIISSTTKLHFHAPLSLLKGHFLDLQVPLDGLKTLDDRTTMVHLKLAPSEGVISFLYLLSPHRSSAGIKRLFLAKFRNEQQAQGLYRLLKGTFEMARVYGCLDLLESLRMLSAHSAPLQFLLACVAKDEEQASHLGKQLVDGARLEWMVEELLREYAPAFEERWTRLWGMRRKAWMRCIGLMGDTQPMADGNDGFDRRCEIDESCLGAGRVEWKDLRLRAAGTVWDLLDHAPKVRGCLTSVRAAVRNSTGCDQCAKRLLKTFDTAMEETIFKMSTDI